MTIHFSRIDWIVLFSYLGLLTIIGLYHSRRKSNARDYFLAENSMGWVPIGLSLMAALNSGMDYLMQPSAYIKFGIVCFVGNLTWFLLYPYVFFITVPMFRRLSSFTAYEYLEKRFGLLVRNFAAGIFVCWRLAWMAAALCTPSLAICTATGLQDYLTIVICVLGGVVTLYTMLGGIRAVIWNDVLQFCVMFLGLGTTLGVILIHTPGGISSILENMSEMGSARSTISTYGGALSYFLIPMPIVGYFIAVLVSRLATYTCDQVMVQRFQTSRSIQDARKGFVVTAVGDVIWMSALGFVGLALYTHYKRLGISMDSFVSREDQIFPYYMGQVFPAGLVGLVIAAILAASLSSIDSALNSITTVLVVDFFLRLRYGRTTIAKKNKGDGENRPILISRITTVLIGIIGITLACHLSELGSIFEIANKLVNGFTGPILGIFLLGMFTARVQTFSALCGGICGAGVAIYSILWSSPALLNSTFRFLLSVFPESVSTGAAVISFIWPSVFSLLATFLIGYGLSFVFPSADKGGTAFTWKNIMQLPANEAKPNLDRIAS